MIYMASPYTSYPDGKRWAAHDAAFAAMSLMKKGKAVYSPVVHGHHITETTGEWEEFHEDQDHWFTVNEPMMAVCDICVVAMLDGWDKSVGIAREVEYFKREGRSILYLSKKELGLDDSPESML